MKTAQKLEQPKFLKLNLQFFSEDHPFAAEPVEVESHPFAEGSDGGTFSRFAEVPNPLLAPEVPLEQQVQPEGPGLESQGEELTPEEQQIQEEQFLDFSGRKVKVTDPVMIDLHEDYTNLNKKYQQTNQRMLQSEQAVADYQAQLQAQTAAQQSVQPTQPQGMTPERRAEINNTYMEMQYEDKIGADEWLSQQPEIVAANNQRLQSEIDARVNEIVGPIQQQRQLQEEVTNLRAKFPDFEAVTPQIQQLLAEDPNIANTHSLQDLYYQAKGRALDNAPPAPTFESMMADPTNQANIIQNPQIQKMVMENYQKSKLQQTQQIPTVMGNNAGSRVPMSAGERAPRNMQEATAAFERYLGQK